MRCLGVVVFALAGVALGQGLTEYGAAAAGGTAGGAAGKKVSEGVSAIFGKVDQQAKDAAKGKPPVKQQPVAQQPVADAVPATAGTGFATASPGGAPASGTVHVAAAKARPVRSTARSATPRVPVDDGSTVPAPPPAPAPVQRAAVVKAEVSASLRVVDITPPLPPPPPPPQMKLEDLKTVELGTRRDQLLKLGAPASRITMFDNGHLLEIYHYASREATIGVVRLNDGAVASVELR